jgi:hypothetical protein
MNRDVPIGDHSYKLERALAFNDEGNVEIRGRFCILCKFRDANWPKWGENSSFFVQTVHVLRISFDNPLLEP